MEEKIVMKLLALFLAAAAPGFADGKAYAIDPSQSEVTVHVGKSGMFKFAGHEHQVLAPEFHGRILANPENLAASSVQMTFQSKALKVLEKGEPEGDAAKVQTVMLAPSVLDAVQFPVIEFSSESVSGKETSKGAWDLEIKGSLALHGVKKTLTIPLKVSVSDGGLTASGHYVLRQTDFQMTPVSVAGVVKVKDEVAIDYKIVGRPEP
jgi:polyisoprenoid-binding protein YceI